LRELEVDGTADQRDNDCGREGGDEVEAILHLELNLTDDESLDLQSKAGRSVYELVSVVLTLLTSVVRTWVKKETV
jgi:hypothetical protein